MAGLNNTGKNLMLDGFAASALYVSLHSADPGTGGTAEITGGSYARQSAAWGSASSASLSNDTAIVFNVAGTTTINHLGYWSANTGGTFYGSVQLDAEQTFATPGTYTIAIGNLTESVT